MGFQLFTGAKTKKEKVVSVTSSEPSGLLGEHGSISILWCSSTISKNDKYIKNRREWGIITLRSLTTGCGIEQLTSHYTVVPESEHAG